MPWLLVAQTAAPETPLVSWDTWGLIVIGALVVALMLAFRRLFPPDKR